ncbi:MAG TPA: hypothetical protein VIZ68_07895 [Thermoplasmata archaeon]
MAAAVTLVSLRGSLLMHWWTAAPGSLSAIACLTVIGPLVLPNPITRT